MYEKQLSGQPERFVRFEENPRKFSRIAIKTNGRILLIDPGGVETVEAKGNCVLFRQASGSELLRESLASVAEKLRPFGFVRIHRSVLVNSSFVEEIEPRATGCYVLRIKGGREFHVSRTYKKNLQSITTLWFGTDLFHVN
jgi:two-component system LytT family response regulator